MITDNYVSFETAKLLKEKGFNWDCKQVYDLVRPQSCADGKMYDNFPDKNPNAYGELVSAPTLQTAMKWLREVHKMNIEIITYWTKDKRVVYGNRIVHNGTVLKEIDTAYNSYEESCGVAIKYCLENLI